MLPTLELLLVLPVELESRIARVRVAPDAHNAKFRDRGSRHIVGANDEHSRKQPCATRVGVVATVARAREFAVWRTRTWNASTK